MLTLIRDIGLSFCPAWVRTLYRPHSPLTVVRGASLTGAFQTYICSRWFWSGFIAFLSMRGQQYGSALQHENVSTQGWFTIVFFFEYLMFHPLGLLLFYLSLEGFTRFIAGLCLSEVVPSLPIVLAFTIKRYVEYRKTQGKLQVLAAVPDSLEVLADGERLRIAASCAKTAWNASITIGVGGQWYEVEREEKGTPPREHVYLLRLAPAGKILRGYEEYDPAIAVTPQ
jgi:hypothetical protein